MNQILVKELLYKPTSKDDLVNIFGELFCQTIKTKNVFVVKTNDTLKKGMYVMFQKDGLEYTLKNINPIIKDENMFIECDYWEESIIDY